MNAKKADSLLHHVLVNPQKQKQRSGLVWKMIPGSLFLNGTREGANLQCTRPVTAREEEVNAAEELWWEARMQDSSYPNWEMGAWQVRSNLSLAEGSSGRVGPLAPVTLHEVGSDSQRNPSDKRCRDSQRIHVGRNQNGKAQGNTSGLPWHLWQSPRIIEQTCVCPAGQLLTEELYLTLGARGFKKNLEKECFLERGHEMVRSLMTVRSLSLEKGDTEAADICMTFILGVYLTDVFNFVSQWKFSFLTRKLECVLEIIVDKYRKYVHVCSQMVKFLF